MRRWLLFALPVVVALVVAVGARSINHRPFPPDTTPEGAYARIAFSIEQRRPRDAFAYLETEAQWAAYTILEMRKKAYDRVSGSYPPDQRAALLSSWRDEAAGPDGADVFALLAAQRGWIGRLDRDLSGVVHVDVRGERATVVTSRGTRYSFRRRDNGIWGMTMFTAELQAEAERATRDLEVVNRAAEDYDRAKP
ncbi:MAG TPA: hypothetical protein VKU41_30725 [Polyangiaceae bacterium]|nr:hypothetical protein [Polyangiaceae bacterium]